MVEQVDQHYLGQDVTQALNAISEAERTYTEKRVNMLLKDVPNKMAVEEFFRVIAQTFGKETVYDNGESKSIYNSLDLVDPLTDLVYSIRCQHHTPFFVCADLTIGALDSLSEVSICPRTTPLRLPTVFIGKRQITGKPQEQINGARFLPEHAKNPKNLGKDVAMHCKVIWELVKEQNLKPPAK